jgi:hypothetical protein
MLRSTSALLEDRCDSLHLRFSRYVTRTWTYCSAIVLPSSLAQHVNALVTGASHLLTDPQVMTNPYVLTDDSCVRNLSIDHFQVIRKFFIRRWQYFGALQ